MVQLRSVSPGRALTTLALSGALAVGIAACGSSSSSSATASSSTAAAASTSTASGRFEARLTLAKCLRSHGLNVPDPSPNGGAGGAGAGVGGGAFRSLRDQPNFQSAMQACAKYRRRAFGFGNLSPAQQAQFRQDLVKFAECMRSHNIEIPDPTPGSGGGFGIFGQIPSSERNSPEFRTALQSCSTILPFRRGGGAGAGGAAVN